MVVCRESQQPAGSFFMCKTPCDAGRSGRAGRIGKAVAAAAVFLASEPAARANVPELSLWDAVEIRYPTEPGKIYVVQGSDDLKEWATVQGPVYGTGKTVERLVSTRLRPVNYGFYRLKVELEASGGHAPRDLTGAVFQRCAAEILEAYSFGESGKGKVKREDGVEVPFTWTWLRTGANAGEATVSREDGVREVLKLEYAAKNLGRVITEITGLVSGEVYSITGTFGPAASAGTVEPPADLTGRALVTGDAAEMERLVFSSSEAGARVLFTGGDPQAANARAFSCEWKKEGENRAGLTVHLSPEHWIEYKLTFHSPLAGVFVRRVFTGGVFRDQDKGAFSLSAAGR